MAKLKTKQRNKLPNSDLGMPGEEKYPMPNKTHAANAKANRVLGKSKPAKKK